MTNGSGRLPVQGVLTAFDEYLRRVRGVCPGTRRNYTKYVAEFLTTLPTRDGVDLAGIRAPEVVAFIAGLSERYRPRTVEHAATALRVFFRFLRSHGWCENRLVDAVPMVPHRPWFGIWTRRFSSSWSPRLSPFRRRPARPGDHLVHRAVGAPAR